MFIVCYTLYLMWLPRSIIYEVDQEKKSGAAINNVISISVYLGLFDI